VRTDSHSDCIGQIGRRSDADAFVYAVAFAPVEFHISRPGRRLPVRSLIYMVGNPPSARPPYSPAVGITHDNSQMHSRQAHECLRAVALMI
jgi:hypothetical protein